MNKQSASRHLAVWTGLLAATLALPAHAYLDPGAISIFITAVLGAIAAVGYTARAYWDKFKTKVAGVFGGEVAEEPETKEKNEE